jgi:hypothetical protein
VPPLPAPSPPALSPPPRYPPPFSLARYAASVPAAPPAFATYNNSTYVSDFNNPTYEAAGDAAADADAAANVAHNGNNSPCSNNSPGNDSPRSPAPGTENHAPSPAGLSNTENGEKLFPSPTPPRAAFRQLAPAPASADESDHYRRYQVGLPVIAPDVILNILILCLLNEMASCDVVSNICFHWALSGGLHGGFTVGL